MRLLWECFGRSGGQDGNKSREAYCKDSVNASSGKFQPVATATGGFRSTRFGCSEDSGDQLQHFKDVLLNDLHRFASSQTPLMAQEGDSVLAYAALMDAVDKCSDPAVILVLETVRECSTAAAGSISVVAFEPRGSQTAVVDLGPLIHVAEDGSVPAGDGCSGPEGSSCIGGGLRCKREMLLLGAQAAYAGCSSVRLSARHLNGPARSLLDCPSASAYQSLLADMVSREPLLTAALRDSCRSVLEGTSTPPSCISGAGGHGGCGSSPVLVANHPRPLRNQSPDGGAAAATTTTTTAASCVPLPLTLLPLIVTPPPPDATACAAAPVAAGQRQPTAAVVVVVVRYPVSSGLGGLKDQLQRGYAMLSAMPGMVTLLTQEGRGVLFQNAASVAFMGFRRTAYRVAAAAEPLWSPPQRNPGGGTHRGGIGASWSEAQADDFNVVGSLGSGGSAAGGGGGVLAEMFELAPEGQLQDLLRQVAAGQVWRSIVPVPPDLNPGRGTTHRHQEHQDLDQHLGAQKRAGQALAAATAAVRPAIGATAAAAPPPHHAVGSSPGQLESSDWARMQSSRRGVSSSGSGAVPALPVPPPRAGAGAATAAAAPDAGRPSSVRASWHARMLPQLRQLTRGRGRSASRAAPGPGPCRSAMSMSAAALGVSFASHGHLPIEAQESVGNGIGGLLFESTGTARGSLSPSDADEISMVLLSTVDMAARTSSMASIGGGGGGESRNVASAGSPGSRDMARSAPPGSAMSHLHPAAPGNNATTAATTSQALPVPAPAGRTRSMGGRRRIAFAPPGPLGSHGRALQPLSTSTWGVLETMRWLERKSVAPNAASPSSACVVGANFTMSMTPSGDGACSGSGYASRRASTTTLRSAAPPVSSGGGGGTGSGQDGEELMSEQALTLIPMPDGAGDTAGEEGGNSDGAGGGSGGCGQAGSDAFAMTAPAPTQPSFTSRRNMREPSARFLTMVETAALGGSGRVSSLHVTPRARSCVGMAQYGINSGPAAVGDRLRQLQQPGQGPQPSGKPRNPQASMDCLPPIVTDGRASVGNDDTTQQREPGGKVSFDVGLGAQRPPTAPRPKHHLAACSARVSSSAVGAANAERSVMGYIAVSGVDLGVARGGDRGEELGCEAPAAAALPAGWQGLPWYASAGASREGGPQSASAGGGGEGGAQQLAAGETAGVAAAAAAGQANGRGAAAAPAVAATDDAITAADCQLVPAKTPVDGGAVGAVQIAASGAGGSTRPRGGAAAAAAATVAAAPPAQAALRQSGGGGLNCCWHEVTASPLRDPGSGQQSLLLMQVDVTARVRAERQIAEVLETEHRLLEAIFPRHVLEVAAARRRDYDDGVHLHSDSGRPAGRTQAGDRLHNATTCRGLMQLPLATDCTSLATYHPMVTILFADIIGFTEMCHSVPSTIVMQFLNQLYSRLDSLLDVYGVYKVETIGDCYMVAGGLMTRDEEGFTAVRGQESVDELHAAKALAFAKAMLREAAKVNLPTTGKPVLMRIGLHSGPVMSGIVGSKMPRFCLFGDTVNTASRMESTCRHGCIHVSAATREYLAREGDDSEGKWRSTGGVQVKGKGFMNTFYWKPSSSSVYPTTTAGPRDDAHTPTAVRARHARRASDVSYIGGGAACVNRRIVPRPTEHSSSFRKVCFLAGGEANQRSPSCASTLAGPADGAGAAEDGAGSVPAGPGDSTHAAPGGTAAAAAMELMAAHPTSGRSSGSVTTSWRPGASGGSVRRWRPRRTRSAALLGPSAGMNGSVQEEGGEC